MSINQGKKHFTKIVENPKEKKREKEKFSGTSPNLSFWGQRQELISQKRELLKNIKTTTTTTTTKKLIDGVKKRRSFNVFYKNKYINQKKKQ